MKTTINEKACTATKVHRVALTILAAVVSLQVGHAFAQGLPASIKIVVPFSPSGPVDFSARVLAEKMRAQLGIPVIVENKPGANGTVAAMAVKQSAADGSTLLFASSGMLTISPHLEKNLPYDPLTDFVPISTVTYADVALVVGEKIPATTAKQFVALAKEAKQPLSMGSAGNGNITHGYIELFKDAAKIELLHVPYKGAALAMADVLGGQISGTFVGLSTAMPHIKSGKLKALGLVGNNRSPTSPEIPTLVEQGYPGIDFITWTSVMAPKNTPAATVELITNAIERAQADEEVKKKLFNAGVVPWVLKGDKLVQVIKSESARWKILVADKKMASD